MDKKTKLTAVVVDDDADSRKLLNLLLKKHPQVSVVGEADNIPNAMDIIKKKRPDSIFLDIKLQNGNGFDLMDKITTDANVVFVSAFDDYALRAFEVNALDYLQKPINAERLDVTIERLLKKNNGYGLHKTPVQITSGETGSDDFDLIKDDDDTVDPENTNKLDYDDRLFITVDGVPRFIKVSSIQCITAEKDYTYLYMVGGKKVLVLKPMVEWEERLPQKFFVRIHRSTIVNLEYVDKVEKWFNSSYHLYIQAIEQPFQMSRRYASKLKERFK